MKRLALEPGRGYPTGPDVRYRCARCDTWLASRPTHDEPWACQCRNLRIDADAGRFSVDDHDALEIYAGAST